MATQRFAPCASALLLGSRRPVPEHRNGALLRGTTLGNGLAMEKVIDPQAVPDALFGDLLSVIFQAFGALAREHGAAHTDPNEEA